MSDYKCPSCDGETFYSGASLICMDCAYRFPIPSGSPKKKIDASKATTSRLSSQTPNKANAPKSADEES